MGNKLTEKLSPKAWGFVSMGVFLVILPFVIPSFRIYQANLVMIYSIALLGLNMLTGFNGQFSLGHSAFFAVGAYTAAILIFHLEMWFPFAILIAAIISFIAGFLFGFPALRIQGLYLALATLALALAMPQLLKYKVWEQWTGGVQGLLVNKPVAPFGLPLSSDQYLYFICLFFAVITFVGGWNLLRGRLGRAMMAIRDHHIAAESMGINTAQIKSITFGISAMYTGLAGALSAMVVGFVAPDSFMSFLSITFLVGIVTGGLASIPGAIYGALFIQFIPNVADMISKAAPWAIYGVFLIVLMYVMPGGIAAFVKLAMVKFAAWRQKPSSAA